MVIGPLVVLQRALAWIVPWRRELGVYSVVFGAIHFVLVLDGWLAWDIPRMFGFFVHPFRGDYVLAEHGFGLANILGIAALAYAAALVAVSNDYAVRRLGGSVWKFVQRGAYVLWILVLLHTAYFLFMHFLHFDRPVPDPNPLQLPFAVLVGAVFALRWAATLRMWRVRRKDSADAAA